MALRRFRNCFKNKNVRMRNECNLIQYAIVLNDYLGGKYTSRLLVKLLRIKTGQGASTGTDMILCL